MWKHGKTPQGKVRWYCKNCKTTGIRKRGDVRSRRATRLVYEWVLEGKKLKHLAKQEHLTIWHVQKLIHDALPRIILPKRIRTLDPERPLILDAVWIVKRSIATLIAHDGVHVIDWMFVSRENTETWLGILRGLKGTPLGAVSDAQKGLLSAVSLRFGVIPHQRCIIHVARQARTWLTQHPKYAAGVELLHLVSELGHVKTTEDAVSWNAELDILFESHHDFLKERSHSPEGKWWYTHRKLRGVRSLLLNARSNLFTYLSTPLPRTSNHLEGGINGPLKAFLKEHRGLRPEQKMRVTDIFLSARARRKNQH